MEHDIGSAFLIIGLIFPRFVLFFWWITGNLPFNVSPIWADVLLAAFLPRSLFCWWIYDIQGASGWFLAHMTALIVTTVWNVLTFDSNVKKLNNLIGN